jgi:hypothetical protein
LERFLACLEGTIFLSALLALKTEGARSAVRISRRRRQRAAEVGSIDRPVPHKRTVRIRHEDEKEAENLIALINSKDTRL